MPRFELLEMLSAFAPPAQQPSPRTGHLELGACPMTISKTSKQPFIIKIILGTGEPVDNNPPSQASSNTGQLNAMKVVYVAMSG